MATPAFGQAGEVLSITDAPEFASSGESIWGPTSGPTEFTFRQDLRNLRVAGQRGGIRNGCFDGRTASLYGPTEFLCGSGTFLDTRTGDCWECPDTYLHDPLKFADQSGVCYKIDRLVRAVDTSSDPAFICPLGEFPYVLTGGCYGCPADYVYNSVLPPDVTGVCAQNLNTTATYVHAYGCTGNDFDGLDGYCYGCRANYSHNSLLTAGTPGVCYQDSTANRKNQASVSCPSGYTWQTDAASCVQCPSGYSYYTFGQCRKVTGQDCLPWPLDSTCWDTYDYRAGSTAALILGCPSGQFVDVTDGYCYQCPGGSVHWDPTKQGDQTGVCRYLDTASQTKQIGCSGNEFPDTLLQGCYECPAVYTHDPALPVDTAGVCFQNNYTTASRTGDITFLCPAGQFYDLASGSCMECPSGYRHNPAFPGDIPGVCYHQIDTVASRVGGTQLLCPTGTFPDVVTGQCFSCPNGFTWNPAFAVDQNGVCFALSLDCPAGQSNFQLGFQIDFDSGFLYGVEGGLTVDQGSVDVRYAPATSLNASRDLASTPGTEIFDIATGQDPANTTLTMSSTWPGVTMYVDPYLDAHDLVTARVAYPELTGPGLVTQHDETFSLLDRSTNGDTRLGVDPLAEFYVGVDGLRLSLLGNTLQYAGGFDPPIEFGKEILPNPTSPIKVKYTLVELGVTTPDMNTPARTNPPYEGDHSTQTVLEVNADTARITHSLAPGSRSGFQFGILGGGAKDTDLFRLDLDLDGFYAAATDEPLGILVQRPTEIPGVNYWKVSGSILDVDIASIFGFRERLTFEPHMDVELIFSRPVRVETAVGSGIYETQPVYRKRVRVGQHLRFIHPGGRLTVDTVYDLANNRFTNDTDLIVSPIIEGEILSLRVEVLGMPPDFPNKVAALQLTGDPTDIWPEIPIPLANMDFLNQGSQTEFTLGGFDSVSGGQLVIDGSEPDCSQFDGACSVGRFDAQASACVLQPTHEGETCSDACTIGGTCVQGTCGGGAPVDCSHMNSDCLRGVCNLAQGGCVTKPTNEGGACNDGDLCTRPDQCAQGVCVGSAVDCRVLDTDCLEGICDTQTGTCTSRAINDGQGCTDFCTSAGACSAGTCTGGAPTDCDDGLTCTVDSCDPKASACMHVMVEENAACLNACTDGVDNDGDTFVDTEDSGCASLAVCQPYALVSTSVAAPNRRRQPTSMNLVRGGRILSQNGNSPGSATPYPVGNSKGGACSADGTRVGWGYHVGGDLVVGGDLTFVGPAVIGQQLVTAGGTIKITRNATQKQFVGPPVLCSDRATPCSAGCAPGDACDRPREVDDPLNDVGAAQPGYVDQTGTAAELQRCQGCITQIAALAARIQTLAIDRNLGKLLIPAQAKNVAPIVVPAVSQYVLGVESLRVGINAEQVISGDPETTLIVRVAGRFVVRQLGRITLSGLLPEHVIFSVEGDRPRSVRIGLYAAIAGTILAPDRDIVLRRTGNSGRGYFKGSAFGKQIRAGYHRTVLHVPFTSLISFPP